MMPPEVSGNGIPEEELPEPAETEDAVSEPAEDSPSVPITYPEEISGNQTGGGDFFSGYPEQEPAQSEALVNICTEINRNVVAGTVSVCILLGLLTGIVFIKGFAGFLKGV